MAQGRGSSKKRIGGSKTATKRKLTEQAVKEAGIKGYPFASSVVRKRGDVKAMRRRKGK